MKSTTLATSSMAVTAALSLLFVSVLSAPMESDEEQSENSLVLRPDSEVGVSTPWDAIDTAALRKLLLQLDANERMSRVSRSWPQSEPRWGLRSVEGRLARPWRADKRQVRFRQCYFNPISCFRKMSRVSRSWPQSEPRWGLRSVEGRLARPWRADKRQVRFRQCYFNPISCFRKMSRVSRSWPQSEPRWGLRSVEGRLARPWRADKRQVRFRQCYFNPISCFRK